MDAEYSLFSNSLVYLNRQPGSDDSFVSLFHQFRCRSQITIPDRIRITGNFIHDLGIQYFFDSISRFQPDENTLDTRLEITMGKYFCFSLVSVATTRLFNSYDYSKDGAGHLTRTPATSFMTPFLWIFSTGIGFTVPGTGKLNIGISSGKFTWIRNRGVFDGNDIPGFYGVPGKKRFVFEYGLSIHLFVDQDLLDRIHWNCDLLVFKNFGKPVDMTIKNLVTFRISKFVKTSIQTRLDYEKDADRCLQVENLVSVGFCFTLLRRAP